MTRHQPSVGRMELHQRFARTTTRERDPSPGGVRPGSRHRSTESGKILNLLYNIVDRIYIARIHDIGTTALGAVGDVYKRQALSKYRYCSLRSQ